MSSKLFICGMICKAEAMTLGDYNKELGDYFPVEEESIDGYKISEPGKETRWIEKQTFDEIYFPMDEATKQMVVEEFLDGEWQPILKINPISEEDIKQFKLDWMEISGKVMSALEEQIIEGIPKVVCDCGKDEVCGNCECIYEPDQEALDLHFQSLQDEAIDNQHYGNFDPI